MKKSSKIPSNILEKFELKERNNEIQYIVLVIQKIYIFMEL